MPTSAKAGILRNQSHVIADKSLFGAGNEARTRDLKLGKLALYQLSYTRIHPFQGNHLNIYS